MSFINLTPHAVQVFNEAQFVGLEQVNPTTWVADSVEGAAISDFESAGVLRISTETVEQLPVDGVPMVATKYGELTGVPEGVMQNDRLIVSLPAKSMAVAAGHPLAGQMVSPYKVVRSRENGSLVLGCMGFTY